MHTSRDQLILIITVPKSPVPSVAPCVQVPIRTKGHRMARSSGNIDNVLPFQGLHASGYQPVQPVIVAKLLVHEVSEPRMPCLHSM